MLHTNKQRINQVYECVKTFHSHEDFPPDIPDPQHPNLLPTLRPYQVKAVKWMLSKELHPSLYSNTHESSNSSKEQVFLLPKGGILAEEMGLGKTVEVLACVLSNPRNLNDIKPNLQSGMIVEDAVEEIKVKSEEVINPPNELVPIEDGTVEIGSVDMKEDLQLGISNLDNMGKVEDINISETTNKSIQNYDIIERDNTLHKRGKTRKRVTFDTTTINSEPKKRKINHCPTESKKSPIDITIDDVIVKHCYDGVAPQPRPKRRCAMKGETLSMLTAWYEDCLSETSVRSSRIKKFQQQSTFQCCCVNEITSDNVVECPKCKTWQHADCVGYDEQLADYQYYCFRCWTDQPPVVSAGTVIISPEAISQQWVSEIEKHIKKDNLRILVYEGVRATGYIQPHDLATYDIVITTYQVLSKELNYTEPVTRTMRHAKRFFAPTSPLLFVQWWRLCLDEAQMVEGSTCKAAEMAKKFSAVNKWAVTGTPIQKAVNDLVGLMEFLAGSDYPEFLEMINKDWRSLLKMVPRVLWRTQMKDVLAETGVPPQTVDTHLLHFSKIEKYFYQCTHTECSQQFINRINRFTDLNKTLKSLDRKVISNLLNPLLRLRQACLHPQAVRGKFMSIKKTMTMADLVTQMVTNAKLDAEQAIRQLVAALNGKGALHIIRNEWAQAAASYREVLHLEQEHKARLKIDSLQKIHTMHNLAEILDGDYDGIPPTLRDSTLREDIKALELRYLGKREAPMTVTEERIEQHAEAVAEQLDNGPLSNSMWWLWLLEWTTDRDELLDRLKAAIQQTDVQQKNQYNNLAKKLNSLYIVRMEIASWLAEVDKTRDDVCRWIQLLKASDKDEMATDALVCHLPQAASIKRRNRCTLCQAETVLKKYEALLFEERSKEKRKIKNRNLPGSSNWGDDDLSNKEITGLVGVNVNTFESSKKGGFKASPIEKIMRALAAYGRNKQVPSRWIKEANQQINILDRLKKEFLDINLMWRQIFDLVDAKDELNMCKTRLRLPFADEKEEQIEKKAKTIGENHHIIALYKVEPELHKLENERKQHEALLKKKVGTLCYLENLKKEGSSESVCPICRVELADKWSVLACGHCMCLECLLVIRKPQSTTLPCPQCRQLSQQTDISYVESHPAYTQSQNIKGSHSTKVNGVLSQTLRLISEQPDVKILVFSAWNKVLDLLAEAFQENNISFKQMKTGKLKQRQVIKDFKSTDVTVLLLPLRSGAKGLNLVEATHVFFVEPILNPAEELQAVGRVHRIGQTKPTVVHRFIVQETIEERILAAVAASGADQWSDDCVTLQQLFDLFSSSMDQSVSVSEAGPSVDNDSSDSDEDSDSEDDFGISNAQIDSNESGDEL